MSLRFRWVLGLLLGGLGLGVAALPRGEAEERGSQGAAVGANQAVGNVDLTASRIYIFVPKAGFGHDHAIEGRLKSGRLQLGANQDAGELVFDMASFDADTNAARRYIGLAGATDAGTRREVNANMRGPSVLDVRRFPTATFAIASAVRGQQPGRRGVPYTLTGKFTLHGTSRALTLQVEVEEKEGGARVAGSFPLIQTHYGITPFSKAFGAVGVADRLTVHGDLALKK